MIATVASWLIIIVYLWWRFQSLTYGLAAVLAVVHDVLITLGAVAVSYWLATIPGVNTFLQIDQFKIDLPMVAAFLTLIGFSVNDTIVIFDRIREIKGKTPYLTNKMVNDAINQTLSRTILTSFTAWLVVVILYFFGGEGLHGFAFALVVGFLSGTYSTVYIATPILIDFVATKPGRRPRSASNWPRCSPEPGSRPPCLPYRTELRMPVCCSTAATDGRFTSLAENLAPKEVEPLLRHRDRARRQGRCHTPDPRRFGCPGPHSPNDPAAGRAHSNGPPAPGRRGPIASTPARNALRIDARSRGAPHREASAMDGGETGRHPANLGRGIGEVRPHVEPDADQDSMSNSVSIRSGKMPPSLRPLTSRSLGQRIPSQVAPSSSSFNASIIATAVASASFGSDSTARPWAVGSIARVNVKLPGSDHHEWLPRPRPRV